MSNTKKQTKPAGMTIGEICYTNRLMYQNSPPWIMLSSKEKQAWEEFAAQHPARQILKPKKSMMPTLSEHRWGSN